ncbi:MAG TPA: DUF1569 domain-containing protein [Salinimicrobium sp.]|nr:DUF1569 domain-containing protein [Salinimicrobium sp.]
MASNQQIINRQLNEIASYIDKKDIKNPLVSKATVGWHLAHLLKVMEAVHYGLEVSKPEDYKPTLNFKKIFVFVLGKIPRGKARAPKSVVPEEDMDQPTLELKVQEAIQKFSEFEKLSETANFKHPYFGYLNKTKTLKFLRIHNEHHLKIVRDVVVDK